MIAAVASISVCFMIQPVLVKAGQLEAFKASRFLLFSCGIEIRPPALCIAHIKKVFWIDAICSTIGLKFGPPAGGVLEGLPFIPLERNF